MVLILIGVIVNGLNSFHNKDERVMKYQLSNNLWSNYQKTMFKLAKLPNLKENLAIITAYNPWGLPASTADNIYSNRELAHVLEAKAVKLIEVLAGNHDFSYYEASFIFKCERIDAIAFGRQWHQNAVYWIEQGQLYLLDCRPYDKTSLRETIAMGAFIERTRIIPKGT